MDDSAGMKNPVPVVKLQRFPRIAGCRARAISTAVVTVMTIREKPSGGWLDLKLINFMRIYIYVRP